MNEDLHARARRLIDEERVEDELSNADHVWLANHLRDCDACNRAAERTDQALASLRSASIDLPRNLAGRTQLRVRLRADELQERNASHKLLWAVSGVSWALGVASAPWVWRGFAWIGEHSGLPKPVWEIGFVLWWAIPAVVATGAILAGRKGEFDQYPE
jgi:anti-sigma factor RsiW